MRYVLFVLIMTPSLAAAQAPKPYQPLPELTDAEVKPPNHVLTSKNREQFAATEVIPVGENLVVVLPVRQAVAYRWSLELPKNPDDLAAFNNVFRRLNPPQGEKKNDLRAPRKDFGVEATGPLGRVDALQVFQFKVQTPSPPQGLPVRFRLVDVINGAPSDVVFEARVRTGDRVR
jgi:hypothetical protein